MLRKIRDRFISCITAAVMTAAHISTVMPLRAADAQQDLTYRSIELYPNGKHAEQVVTLDGMMPEGARARAVDVSEDYEGEAAYDITIKDGWEEYQPGTEHPILVEITDPVITENITLWHIHDFGAREQIFDYTVEEGRVSFYATGFSVYEIVNEEVDFNVTCDVVPVTGSTSSFETYTVQAAGEAEMFSYPVVEKTYPEMYGTATQITGIDDLKLKIADGEGFYIRSNAHGSYAKNSQCVISGARTGISVTTKYTDANVSKNMYDAYNAGAQKYYFEEVDASQNQYYIYTYDDENEIQYVGWNAVGSNNNLYLTNDKNATTYPAHVWKVNIENGLFYFKDSNANRFWTSKYDNDNTRGFANYTSNSTGEKFSLWSYTPPDLSTDPYELDGNIYGLVNFQSATKGSALLAGNYNNSGNTLGNNQYLTPDSGTPTVYTSSYGITGWKFEWVGGTRYRISAIADDGASWKYLKLDSTGLSLTADASEATELTVVPGANNRIRLTADGRAVNRNGDTSFNAATSNPNDKQYFDLVDVSGVTNDGLSLNGSTFGLVSKQSATIGNAMMASAYSATHLDNQVVTAGDACYVFPGGISTWTFHNIDTNRYTISNGSQYLKLDRGGLYVSDTPYILTVVAGEGDNAGKIRILNTSDKCLIRKNGNTSFYSNTDFASVSADKWFDLVTVPEAPASDPLGLDGNTYGIMNRNNALGYAMMAEAETAAALRNQNATFDSDALQYKSFGAISGWTFHWQGYANYTLSATAADGTERWIKFDSTGISLVDASEATPITVEVNTGNFPGRIRIIPYLDNNISSLQRANANFGRNINSNYATGGQYWHDLVTFTLDDPYSLDGKSYGLIYSTGGSIGYALEAEASSYFAELDSIVTRDASAIKTYYVSQESDITLWSFEKTQEDRYRLKAPSGQYLTFAGDALALVDTADSAADFRILPQSDGSIYVACASGYLAFDGTGFSVAGAPSKLHFVKKTDVTGSDSITYTADRISVSDGEKAKDGEQVIVYTRIWDDANKRYEFFAIDHDGSLKEVYAYGDKIMWLGDAVQTLWWKLTVYENADGSETGYYELQNTYSGKYLAPQISGSQTLSDTKIGIQLPGRSYEKVAATDETTGETTYTYNYGEYYSAVIAWDKRYYDYASLDAVVTDQTTKTGEIRAASYAAADTFYFAVPDDVFANEQEATLHPVKTIDNTEYGISMKMIDFGDDSLSTAAGSDVTKYYFGGDSGNTTGLLSTRLDADGHPIVVKTSDAGKDFGDAFNDAVGVNHLFINSIHESSGYFEFDSTQNYATLLQADGTVGNEFTVYRELGTHDSSTKNSLRHGQFFPYNTIEPGVFDDDPAKDNDGLNLYTFDATTANDTTVAKGQLSDDDPRKYEKLYKIQDPDYYFGMEMEAEFVQTPSGLDAWGHDIIFEFTGDDDFWLYVDGELEIDLGGIHSAEACNVNFRTGKVVVNGQATTLKQIFTEHYKTYPYTEEEAKAKILRVDCDADRNITLAEFEAWYHTEYEDARTAYVTDNPDAEEAEITAYLTKNLANRKVTYDEFKEHYPDQVAYDTLLAGYLAQNHDDEATEFYISSIFEPNGETGDNAGYVFKDYTTHHMKIYYMERGAGASNLHMRFNLSAVTPGNVLFAKQLSGVSAKDDMDYSMVQYPFQIFWKFSDDANEPWRSLTNKDDENHLTVKYQNSTQTVRFAEKYTPAVEAAKPVGERHIYDNVFFLVPGRSIEISFPDNAMYYQIIECAVNTDIYDTVSAMGGDGNEIQLIENVVSGNIKDLIAEATQVKEQPTIAFDNQVRPGGVRSLNITKILYNEEDDGTKQSGHRLSHAQDPTTFSYRLYLSNGVSAEMQLANLQRYYVLDEDNYLCTWDSDTQEFVRYTPQTQEAAALSEEEKHKVTFHTSQYGAISNIPAGYTVKVPGLVAGTRFMIEERDNEIPVGYGLMDYECGTELIDGVTAQASYLADDPDNPNTGTILTTSDAHAIINNQRGFGIRADKVWSDTDFASGHGTIYTAVYVGDSLTPLPGSVKSIETDETAVQYFYHSLEPGRTLSDYRICEVLLTDPVKNSDGSISYSSITKLENESLLVSHPVTDHNGTETADDYMVSYMLGPPEKSIPSLDYENARTDTIKNTRKGGLAINLHVWNTTSGPDTPLADGTFRLTRTRGGAESAVGTYISDADGSVTVLYHFEAGDVYKLEETISPRGYLGLTEPIYFTITKTGDVYSLVSWKNENDSDMPKLDPETGEPILRTDPNTGAPIPKIDPATNEPVLKLDPATGEPIPETDPVTGEPITDPEGNIVYQIEYETVPESDLEPTDGKYWAEYNLTSGIMVATIDVYNKPFTLQVVKADSENTDQGLGGAHFELYKSVMSSIAGQIKDFRPLTGYEDLITDANGVIPGIDQTLLPRTYYLTETQAPPGYEGLSEDIVFEIRDNGEISCDERFLARREETVGGTLHVTFTISIPNVRSARAYYFDIEKLILIDRYVHDEDTEQKFLFKVERFADEDAYNAETVAGTFYVTMNCDRDLTATGYPYALSADTGHNYNESRGEVTITYDTDRQYTFPAGIWQGRQTVMVSEGGIYRVSEVSDWSSTDYDPWEGANIYTGCGSAIRQGQTDGYVVFNVESVKADRFENETAQIDGATVGRPTASFTNTETEYAYLSSQAYAENAITRK
ncbi:MAG: hypothetical protein IJ055_02755 [Oscillospiraceae bacterium]|nr:hypothetical protein [Oscillospiraceae bacterium]